MQMYNANQMQNGQPAAFVPTNASQGSGPQQKYQKSGTP